MEKKEYTPEELLSLGFTLDEVTELFSVEKKKKDSKYIEPKNQQEELLDLDPLRSILAGVLQGATFGLADNIIGDKEGKIKSLEQQNPGLFLTGELAGGVLTPLPGAGLLKSASKAITKLPTIQKIIQGVGTGAIAGGLQSLGTEESPTIQTTSEDALKGALLGGALTGVTETIPVVGKNIAKLAIPSPASREKIADVFSLAKEKIKTTGEDITEKPFFEKEMFGITTDVTKFVENLIKDVNKKRQSLYEEVARIADEAGVKIPTKDIKNKILNLDEAENSFKKVLLKALPEDDSMSYSQLKNIEEKIEKYIKYPSTPFATKEAAMELKADLKDMAKKSLPEEGLKALEIADDYYKRIAGIDPKTGEAIGDFYAVTGKNILDLPKYDKAAMVDEITKITNRLLEQGQGFKYNVTDPYYVRLKNFDEFVKQAQNPELVKEWDKIKNRLSEAGLLSDIFQEGTKVQKPSLANINPETFLTKVAYSTAATTGKAAGRLEKTFEPLSKLISSTDPVVLEQKIREFESKGNKGIADYLRNLMDRFSLGRAQTLKPAKIAAQQFVEAQNPGLKDLKKDLVKEEQEDK